MPPEAPMPAAEPALRRGTVESFRLLTGRLKRQVPPAGPTPPPVVTVVKEPRIAAQKGALLDGLLQS